MCDPTDACGSEKYFNLFHHYYSLLLILCSFVMKKWHFLSFHWLKYLKLASHGLLNPVPTGLPGALMWFSLYQSGIIWHLLKYFFLQHGKLIEQHHRRAAHADRLSVVGWRVGGTTGNQHWPYPISQRVGGMIRVIGWPGYTPNPSHPRPWGQREKRFTLQQSVIRDQCCTEPSLTDCIRYCTSEV